MRTGCILPRPMENSDESDHEPEDIFEEIDPTESPSIEARIRAGDEVDIDELDDEFDLTLEWDTSMEADRAFLEYLERKRAKETPPPPPKPDPEPPTP